MQFKVFFKTFPETSRCPSCSKIGRIRRSRSRNVFEYVLKLSKLWGIYKCRECGWRGYLGKYSFNKYSVFTLSLYIFLIFLVAYVIIKILQRNFGIT